MKRVVYGGQASHRYLCPCMCCRGGVQVRMFFSVQQDEVYIKVRASTSRLKLEAARTGYKVRTNINNLSVLD